MMIMVTPTGMNIENSVSLHDDTIVCRLDLFPELVRALRDGDLLAGRLFCAQLFGCEGQRYRIGELTPALPAAMHPRNKP
jgi:hypothetical protein